MLQYFALDLVGAIQWISLLALSRRLILHGMSWNNKKPSCR